MPHKCVRCGEVYDDGASEILKGCKCGAKLFLYFKKSNKKVEQIIELSDQEKNQIEKDVYDLIGAEADKNAPVILDIESIHIVKPGKFELDLVNLFNKKQPLVYKLEDGKYVIDLPNTFLKARKKK